MHTRSLTRRFQAPSFLLSVSDPRLRHSDSQPAQTTTRQKKVNTHACFKKVVICIPENRGKDPGL